MPQSFIAEGYAMKTKAHICQSCGSKHIVDVTYDNTRAERLSIATAVLRSIYENYDYGENHQRAAIESLRCADALLKELDRSQAND